ncbi:MAG: hypothetical protein FJZ01_14240 [Candidatus Sericytochromatia bacterium]|nr:hypothetical protein [Candidatus Tanganyikabacteria bacterium]
MPSRASISPAVLRDLRRILHNVDDHTKVLLDILSQGGIRGGALARLSAHMRFEEAESRRRLAELKAEAPELAREFDTLTHHSELLEDMASGGEVDVPLAIKLLRHFAEEHEWLAEDLGRPARSGALASPARFEPTVGSLLGPAS